MGKHYVVVGGTKGAGRVLVESLCGRDRRVSVLSRKRPPHPHADVLYRETDICNSESTKRQLKYIVRENGPVNYLIFAQRFRGSGDKWNGEIATTLTASREIVRSLSKSFVSKGDKAIVFIGSVAAQFILPEQDAGYHVARAGLLQLMRYYAMALGPMGIRANCVSMGTMLKDEALPFYESNRELLNSKSALSPLGRMGRPKDVVDAVSFLCSNRASFITGHNLIVDGGITMLGHETLARSLQGRDLLHFDEYQL